MRIATYTRICTDEDHQPYSLDAQATRLRSYAASQEGWAIVRQESDQKSGATLDRPGLQKLLREGEAGRFDLLLVYRVDRVARSVRGLAQIIERLDEATVLFRSATEPFASSATPTGSKGRSHRPLARRPLLPHAARRAVQPQGRPDHLAQPRLRRRDRLPTSASRATATADRHATPSASQRPRSKRRCSASSRACCGRPTSSATRSAKPPPTSTPTGLAGSRADSSTPRSPELTDDEAEATGAILTDDDIDNLQAQVEQTIRHGDPPTRKALMQALVGEIRVDGRDRILPTYLLPAGVRIPAGSVSPRGFEARFPP